MLGRLSGGGEIASAFTAGDGAPFAGGAGGRGGGCGNASDCEPEAGSGGSQDSMGMHSHGIGSQMSSDVHAMLWRVSKARAIRAITTVRIIEVTSISLNSRIGMQ